MQLGGGDEAALWADELPGGGGSRSELATHCVYLRTLPACCRTAGCSGVWRAAGCWLAAAAPNAPVPGVNTVKPRPGTYLNLLDIS
eukprot:SAG31_NODE_2596_length_5420_cov_45.220330_4_plen_86_part_00